MLFGDASTLAIPRPRDPAVDASSLVVGACIFHTDNNGCDQLLVWVRRLRRRSWNGVGLPLNGRLFLTAGAVLRNDTLRDMQCHKAITPEALGLMVTDYAGYCACEKLISKDMHQIWRSRRGRRRNHLWQIFWWSVKACGFCGGRILPFPVDKPSHR